MKTFRGAAVLLFATAFPALLGAQAGDRSRFEFYQSTYTEISPDQDPRAARAHEIFGLLLKVAGTRSGLVPRLFIAKKTSPPLAPAVAIPDGGVIISEDMLELCYQSPDRGDDRLAYILAHEIAHQLKNDFWPVKFVEAVDLSRKNDPKDGPALDAVKRELDLDKEEVAADQRRKELEADEMGIVYASLAGFDTRAVVMGDGSVNLFRFVETYLDPTNIKGVAKDASHPTPEARAAAVKARLEKVLDSVDLFDIGLLFYRTGDFERAAQFFTEFLREYPGREVYHNLATCHHQMARSHYREWKGTAAFPFKLSLPAEAATRARKIVLRGTRGGAPGPSAESRFKDEIGKAVEFYRLALAQDPAYWPSANNLGCALLLLENPYEAVGVLQRALQNAPGSALVLNNLGVAYQAADNSVKAKEQLQASRKADPAYDAPLFNLSWIASLENDQAGANTFGTAYLELDPDSEWAAQISQKLGKAADRPAASAPSDAASESVLGLAPLDYDDKIPADWGPAVREKTLLGAEDGYVLKTFGNGVTIVAKGGEILRLCVAAPFKGQTAAGLAAGAPLKYLTARYGRPASILPSSLGEAWIYPSRGISFVLVDGKVASWILFRRS